MVSRTDKKGIISAYLPHAVIADVDDALQHLERCTGRRVSRSVAIESIITSADVLAAVYRAAGLEPVGVDGTVRRILPYYGSKNRLGQYYPPPQYPLVIEPFAGGAGYSNFWLENSLHDIRVHLNDLDQDVCAAWNWIKNASPEEVRALPDESTEGLPDGARQFTGFWLGKGSARPRKTRTSWGALVWHQRRRNYLASQVSKLRDWKITNLDYRALPDVEATWFIDPPYCHTAGEYYKHSRKSLDFDELALWCKSRKGQVIVCESVEASWLPFQPLDYPEYASVFNGRGALREAVWIQQSRTRCWNCNESIDHQSPPLCDACL